MTRVDFFDWRVDGNFCILPNFRSTNLNTEPVIMRGQKLLEQWVGIKFFARPSNEAYLARMLEVPVIQLLG